MLVTHCWNWWGKLSLSRYSVLGAWLCWNSHSVHSWGWVSEIGGGLARPRAHPGGQWSDTWGPSAKHTGPSSAKVFEPHVKAVFCDTKEWRYSLGAPGAPARGERMAALWDGRAYIPYYRKMSGSYRWALSPKSRYGEMSNRACFMWVFQRSKGVSILQ